MVLKIGNRAHQDPMAHGDALGAPGLKYVPVTKADADLPNGPCRTLIVTTAGTLNLTEYDGTVREGVPVFVGYNPLIVLRVRPGGTADGIWAVY